MSFVPCELHCHTVHSDGDFSVRELQESAKQNGLSLIALTDHNTFSGYDEIDNSKIQTVKGIEWTTYFGHMLVLGVCDFIDWRDATVWNIDEKIKAVKKSGSLVGIAHPFQLGSPMCTGGRWEFEVNNWNNVDYIEIWHERFRKENYENVKATKLWTSLLDKGYHLACTYGRDWHRKEKTSEYGCTYLDIKGEISVQNALDALKCGRSVVSTGALFYFDVKQNNKIFSLGETVDSKKATFEFYVNTDIRKDFHTDNKFTYETIKIKTNGDQTVCEVKIGEKFADLNLKPNSWYRCELWGKMNSEETALAITSPIYTN